MSAMKKLEAVGWKFFVGLLVVLSPPCIFFAYQLTTSNANTFTRWSAGLFAAAAGAGLITTVINEILYRRNLRRYNEQRKAERKKKKKKKKSKK